jgi:hypothetical protein
MYKHLFLLAAVAMGLSACGPVYVVQQTPPPPPPAPAAPPPANPDEVSYQTFYDQLSPYGQWIQDPDYGYVWMPDVSPDFKPYATNGHWVYTDEGWAWDSDYPWGWAAFHYGRWFFRDGYGWMWIPGTDWAPAWVSWRNSDDYYGWAPMEPGISVSMAYSSGYNPPPHYWSFVPHQYVASPQINNYYVQETNNSTIINRTTVINNTTIINHYGNNRYGGGPDPNDVGRFTGAPLRPTPIRESRTPGGQVVGGGFTVYRPRVNSAPPSGDPHVGSNGRAGYAPSSFRPLNNARPVNRTSYNPAPATPPAAAPPAQTPPPGTSNPGTSNPVRPNRPPFNGGNNGGNNGGGQPARGVPPVVQPSGQQPALPNRQPLTRRPLGYTPNSNPAKPNTLPGQNTNQPRPVGGAPKPAPQQRNPPPPPKKEDERNPNKR